MHAAEIHRRVRAMGISLAAEGGYIAARPKGRTSPELAAAIRANKAELLILLRMEQNQTNSGMARAAGRRSLPEPHHPAYSILETCQRYGVLLRIDDAGDLVVGKAGAKAYEPTQPWPSLIIALEAHLESVAALVRAGWSLNADLPRYPVA